METYDADVVVIGAGIIGAACAAHLADRGQRVIVVEAMRAPAMGSTARSNACVRAQWRDETNIALAWHSIRQYRDFAALYGTDIGYRPIGYLLLHSPEQWDAQLAAVELQRGHDVPVEVLTPGRGAAPHPFRDGRGRGRDLDARRRPHRSPPRHAHLPRTRKTPRDPDPAAEPGPRHRPHRRRLAGRVGPGTCPRRGRGERGGRLVR
jgi:glycine/D-amino acid oxidase-like deaminating enzyme